MHNDECLVSFNSKRCDYESPQKHLNFVAKYCFNSKRCDYELLAPRGWWWWLFVSIPKGAIMSNPMTVAYYCATYVSIPKGAIMSSTCLARSRHVCYVSIPKGAIMRAKFERQNQLPNKFQFQKVRLWDNLCFLSFRCPMFQFQKVRLWDFFMSSNFIIQYVSIPKGAIMSYHLKPSEYFKNKFQFQKVRLWASWNTTKCVELCVSIPKGAIMSTSVGSLHIGFLVSIPKGAIMSARKTQHAWI